MPPRVPIPAELGPSFRVATGHEAGLTASRMRGADLSRLFRGVRMAERTLDGDRYERERLELRARCAAYAPLAPPEWRFSHVTAARLYGIPVPRALELRREVDVSVPVTSTHVRRAGVLGHRLMQGDGRNVDGLPLVHPEVAWSQLAALVNFDELVVAGDYLVRRKRPLSSMEKLVAVTAGMRGSRGARTARSAVGEVRPGTDSPRESVLRLIIVRSGLPEPVVGFEVIDRDGYFVGRPDLAWVESRIAIEYEGEGHWGDREVFENDILRRERFEAAGWRVFRVTAAHIGDPHRLVQRLNALRAQ